MTERLDELLSARQRTQLPKNEQVLWVGRTRPNFWFRSCQWQIVAAKCRDSRTARVSRADVLVGHEHYGIRSRNHNISSPKQ